MRKSWFTCRVKYQRLDAEGRETKATDSYLLDAMTYTEAEARIILHMKEMVNGIFEVVNITKSNISEVFFYDDADLWFKVKVAFVSFDEESGKESNSNQFYLMAAEDVNDAFKKTNKVMEGTVSGYVIPSITYTKIKEVFWSEEHKTPEGVSLSSLTPLSNFATVPEEPVEKPTYVEIPGDDD
jgi:hypothetical protein